MKQVTKKQKIILIVGVISIIIFSFRPALEQIEMTKVNLDNQSSSESKDVYVEALTDIEITGQKTYANYDENYKVSKGDVRLLSFKDDQFCRDIFKKQCFSKDQFRILSTQDDQIIFNRYFKQNQSNLSTIKFTDLNQDGINDLIILQKPNSYTNYYNYVNFYSAHNNELLWQITDYITDDFYGPLLHAVITDITKGPATIIIYQPEDRKEYSFYKSLNQEGYKVVKPNHEDWRNYWKTVSMFELFIKAFGLLGTLILGFVLFIIAILICIAILISIIKFVIIKGSNIYKKNISKNK